MSKQTGKRQPAARVGVNVNSYGLALDTDVGRQRFSRYESDVERALVWEALMRGATEVQALTLLSRWRQIREQSAPREPPSRYHLLPRLTVSTEPWRVDFFSEIQPIADSYRAMVEAEFRGLSAFVQSSFAFEKNDRLRYYFKIRAAFYQAGYSDPAGQVFAHIGETTLLGKPISGGVHELFATKISGLEPLLNGWKAGLAQEVAAQINGIGGFVPRYIAGSSKLSNHALGLAIDIDPTTNPQLRGETIKVLNKVVAKQGLNYDFGKRLVAKEKGLSPADWAAQTYVVASQASDAVRNWLKKYLDLYHDPDVQAMLGHPNLNAKSTKNLDAETWDNLKLLDELHRYHSAAEIRKWAEQGIQTLPFYLVVGLVKLGLRWGETYETTKDAMHFEFEGAIPPDSPQRPLNDLFNQYGGGPAYFAVNSTKAHSKPNPKHKASKGK